MRKVELTSGEKIEVRGLTRTERRQGRIFGFGPIFFDFIKGDPNAAYEYSCECIGIYIDGIGDDDRLADAKIFRAILDETYGNKDEEKNLSKPGGPGQVKNQ